MVDSNTNKSPYRRIIGGRDDNDEETEFSDAATRNSRVFLLYHDYESEIARHKSVIDSLKDANNSLENRNQKLKNKLIRKKEKLSNVQNERDALKEAMEKIESENTILLQDVQRLKGLLKSQKTSRLTQKALESNLKKKDAEIQRLHYAINKCSVYDLENGSPSSPPSSPISSSSIPLGNAKISIDRFYTSGIEYKPY